MAMLNNQRVHESARNGIFFAAKQILGLSEKSGYTF